MRPRTEDIARIAAEAFEVIEEMIKLDKPVGGVRVQALRRSCNLRRIWGTIGRILPEVAVIGDVDRERGDPEKFFRIEGHLQNSGDVQG
jgi:hypothetical protein